MILWNINFTWSPFQVLFCEFRPWSQISGSKFWVLWKLKHQIRSWYSVAKHYQQRLRKALMGTKLSLEIEPRTFASQWWDQVDLILLNLLAHSCYVVLSLLLWLCYTYRLCARGCYIFKRRSHLVNQMSREGVCNASTFLFHCMSRWSRSVKTVQIGEFLILVGFRLVYIIVSIHSKKS